ncbi:DNA topoisomerase type I [Cetacean poxvirus 1]|nr:DNA topoisomerase type I [Cetacean poxvirus 1]
MRGFYYKDNKLFIDSNFKNAVPLDNPTYIILKRIKIPQHLTNVIIYEQTYEQAITRLIFVGNDSKNRKQYFYGKLHVEQRNSKRNNIFIRVYEVIDSINSYIDKHLKCKTAIDKDKLIKYQFAIFMLMETSFFIRTGKLRYLKENNTVGLLTLKSKHLTITKDKLTISFMGKDKVSHEFVIRRYDKLYKPLIRLSKNKDSECFLFDKLNENIIYKLIKPFGIRIKDLRTYGVNYTFLYNFWNNIKYYSTMSIKKIISMSIKQTAELVGHTPAISKHAYMATTILELVKDDDILNVINNTETINDFINLIIGYVKNRNVLNGL